MWSWPDDDRDVFEHPVPMRILLPTNGSDAEAVAALARLIPQAEVVLAQAGRIGQPLELALRNALAGQEVVTVPIQMVVDAEEPDQPRAILGLRSLRTLIESGAIVICAFDALPPVVIGREGEVEAVEAEVNEEVALDLLARRLDAQRMNVKEVVDELGYARPT
jgi:carbamate kinase